jgi:hypothetical protein
MKHRSYASDQKALSEELAALSEDAVKSLKVRWWSCPRQTGHGWQVD